LYENKYRKILDIEPDLRLNIFTLKPDMKKVKGRKTTPAITLKNSKQTNNSFYYYCY